MAASETWTQMLSRRLGEISDDAALRWLLRGLIAGTLAVAVLDYREMHERRAEMSTQPVEIPLLDPTLPDIQKREGPPGSPSPAQSERLRGRMSFELTAGGRLLATGAITPGTAKAFAEEINKRGSYVKTIVLESPGGSVQDALDMGRLIRSKGYATEVDAGKYCASSCPLVFAGGVERRAGKAAAIGVHQISSSNEAKPSAMADTQSISAVCQKYLRDMGVDLGVWVHAMETPKNALYYFKPAELLSLKLATTTAGEAKPIANKS